ncbi:aromatic acid/H+ symport family MFS transporter [Streptomyces bathyalis]|uniref:Aromatic acid/H+ symport family MFS transporter n=1 Tax=Streptomyces bathyalis TaxID=2710756 RepID=A0A7T1T6R0_9ACTN|nr:aromatic acid/H+ symport family MFS transporter [Streptomyces bathyalis]QPP07401.1 aromatic acid/H+ symport family MFS transporter [Streptomyces bathyalis]
MSSTSPRFSTPAAGANAQRSARGGVWPVLLCWLAVALDGFDLVVLGAVIPTLTKTHALGFDPGTLTTAATLGLVGVGIGAVAIGPLTDRFGRRASLMTCIAAFSVLTLAIAWAPNIATFVALRFLSGLGLGACLPTALAYMTEYARPGRRGSAVTQMMTGYHVGAVLTAVLAIVVIPKLGWEAMFAVGGLAGLLTLPVMWAKLPESQAFLDARGKVASAAGEPVRPSALLRGRLLRVSLGIWIASFMGLLLVYGLNTWLPQIMGAAGYSVGDSLGLLLALNLGAVAGLLLAGRVSDARGNKRTVLLWFGVSAVFLALLSVKLESTAVVYAAVFLAGVFVFSAQVLVYAFVGHLFAAEVRGTALGLAAGVGRLGAIVGPFLGGLLVSAGVAHPWGFYAFSVAAVLAVLALLVVPANLREGS